MWWWCKDKNCAFYLHCTHMLASCHIFANSSDWRGENAAICDTSCLDYCGGPRNRAKWHKNAHLLQFLTPKGMLKYQWSLFIEGDLIFDPPARLWPRAGGAEGSTATGASEASGASGASGTTGVASALGASACKWCTVRLLSAIFLVTSFNSMAIFS